MELNSRHGEQLVYTLRTKCIQYPLSKPQIYVGPYTSPPTRDDLLVRDYPTKKSAGRSPEILCPVFIALGRVCTAYVCMLCVCAMAAGTGLCCLM
jgi:hypothetical protein